jgi:hypothetical protein
MERHQLRGHTAAICLRKYDKVALGIPTTNKDAYSTTCWHIDYNDPEYPLIDSKRKTEAEDYFGAQLHPVF